MRKSSSVMLIGVGSSKIVSSCGDAVVYRGQWGTVGPFGSKWFTKLMRESNWTVALPASSDPCSCASKLTRAQWSESLPLTDPRTGAVLNFLLTVNSSATSANTDFDRALTVRPCRLFIRPLLQEEATRALEKQVSLDGGDALELGGDCVEVASSEGRPLSDVLGIQC